MTEYATEYTTCQKISIGSALGTLWLLHTELAANRPVATFWYWAFNEFAQRECTEEQLVQGVQHFLEAHEAPEFALSSLHKDVQCFLRTYVPWHGQGRPSAVLTKVLCKIVALAAPTTAARSSNDYTTGLLNMH